ncbi:hypothetical protein RKE29_06700 [Streptomyces sp. B1866]|uniref:hypothetical protein n=1 Tax=Streptomyces sp. B1866 TaxID=3075431 RepID=UPI00288C851A|nr:hypothetical protein [Streptomyces sp. B1866]MDT3396331.1 hypothetical protein [Streptomyces sp. B1866]
MDAAVLSWLTARLGTADPADIQTRYTRLGSARAVLLEVLAERRARLLAEPLRLTVDGVVTLDQSNNLTGIERQMATAATEPAPDDPAAGDEDLPELVVAPLDPDRRYR